MSLDKAATWLEIAADLYADNEEVASELLELSRECKTFSGTARVMVVHNRDYERTDLYFVPDYESLGRTSIALLKDYDEYLVSRIKSFDEELYDEIMEVVNNNDTSVVTSQYRNGQVSVRSRAYSLLLDAIEYDDDITIDLRTPTVV